MKSIFKILALGAILTLAPTAVMDQGLAADKGSQLIFQIDMNNMNYISVSNTSPDAVTVLTQYYNDEMARVLWYLRVIPGGGNVLVDPFNHEIPGTAEKDADGMEISGTGTNVSTVIGGLPAMTNDDDGAGRNSGRFVIAVTAVGANVAVGDPAVENTSAVVNVLFPGFLAEGMHGTDNIDNCGSGGIRTSGTDHLAATKTDDQDDCSDKDTSTKNVGDLSVGNAEPIAFNHLTGSFTEALTSTGAGGADQTASWGGTPVIRPGVAGPEMGMARAYQTLDGTPGQDGDNGANGRLADKIAGGMELADPITHTVKGYIEKDTPNEIQNGTRTHRAINGGSLTLAALYGGGAETHHVIHLLSVADDFGDAGKYMLIPAKTGYSVVLKDGMGDELPDPAADDAPRFGGVASPEAPPGTKIIVEGIRVWTDAGDCNEDDKGNLNEEGLIMGPWTLSDLTSIVPTAATGTEDFDGLDAMLDPAMSASPGSIAFERAELTCKRDYGDGDSASESSIEDPDGVPTTDERSYMAGTLIVEEATSDRSFVTTGQVVLKFITAKSTFGASWSLK